MLNELLYLNFIIIGLLNFQMASLSDNRYDNQKNIEVWDSIGEDEKKKLERESWELFIFGEPGR